MKGFQPDTQLALTWTQLSSGNYVCTDRGYLSDKYECNIQFYGTEITINDIINMFETNRENPVVSNRFFVTDFNSTEHIFGEDVNYNSPISSYPSYNGLLCNVMSIDQRAQRSWKGFGLSMRLAAVSPSFVGSGSLPHLRFLDVTYQADAEYTNNHYRSYRNNFYNLDSDSDIGKFTGTFTLTNNEMAQLRSYIRTQRGSTISLPAISGVQYPFGRKSGSYPYLVKIIDFKDLGMMSVLEWKFQITFAQVL